MDRLFGIICKRPLGPAPNPPFSSQKVCTKTAKKRFFRPKRSIWAGYIRCSRYVYRKLAYNSRFRSLRNMVSTIFLRFFDIFRKIRFFSYMKCQTKFSPSGVLLAAFKKLKKKAKNPRFGQKTSKKKAKNPKNGHFLCFFDIFENGQKLAKTPKLGYFYREKFFF